MKSFLKKDNRGFSMVEIIVVIAITAILVSVISVSVLGQVESAKRAKALTDARAIYITAQNAIINAAMDEQEAFHYALKFEYDGQVMGRFSNQSLYKYLQESGGSGSLSSALSKKADYYIASQLAGSIPNADGKIKDNMLQNKSPIGDSHSTKYISEHPEQYGEVVFAMAYDHNGKILYFNCVYNGYFITQEGNNLKAEKVSDSTSFSSWPASSDRMEHANGW